jgi:TolB-like protein
MHQLLVPSLARLANQPRNLLPTGVKITSNQNRKVPSVPKASVLNRNDLRSTYATRLSAGGVADECVTQLLRQGDARVFRYSQMKLQMKREALEKTNRRANVMLLDSGRAAIQ